MWQREYWRAVVERLVKTLVQAGGAGATVAVVQVAASDARTISDVDWWAVLGAAALAAVYSLLTSLASTKFGASRGPSLAGEVLASEPRHARPEGAPEPPWLGRARAPRTEVPPRPTSPPPPPWAPTHRDAEEPPGGIG